MKWSIIRSSRRHRRRRDAHKNKPAMEDDDEDHWSKNDLAICITLYWKVNKECNHDQTHKFIKMTKEELMVDVVMVSTNLLVWCGHDQKKKKKRKKRCL